MIENRSGISTPPTKKERNFKLMELNDKTNTIPVVESDGKEPSLKLMDIVQDILDIEKRILDIKKKMKELMIQNNEEEPKQKEIDKDFFKRETS